MSFKVVLVFEGAMYVKDHEKSTHEVHVTIKFFGKYNYVLIGLLPVEGDIV